jgi:GDP-4-dehydro-6-deoxy-D-mannose reductase
VKALVTGATGFAGGHLARLLRASQEGPIDGTTIDARMPGRDPGLRLHVCDVTQGDQVERVLADVRPTHLFHLAAPAHVGESFGRPLEAIQAITAGAVTVLAAAHRLDPPPRVLLVSSAEVYGTGDGSPIAETAPLEANSPYGVGKLTGEAFARYLAGRGLPVVIARPFNHIGPGQSDRFVCSAFARQIAEAEAGLRPPLVEVGNLSPERDFTDVRDTVRAYPLILERGKPGEPFNVASGRAIPISRLLEGLVALSKIKIDVRTDKARLREGEAPRRVGDARKLQALGWAPTVPLEQTLRDALDAWRAVVRR